MYMTELELQKDFIRNLRKKIKNHEYISEEFNARFGNVDIIKAVNNGKVTLTKKQIKLISDIAYTKIIALLNKKSPRTIKYLKVNTGYSQEYIASILIKLEKESIITRQENKYLLCEDFIYPKFYFVSYEAKLKDWRKAISQALKNKRFSRKSYVVMPLEFAKKLIENKRDIFISYEIGLIGVKNGKNEILYNPAITKKSKINDALFLCSVGRFLERKEQQAN